MKASGKARAIKEGPWHRVKLNILSEQVAQTSFKRTNRTRTTVSKEAETFVPFYLYKEKH